MRPAVWRRIHVRADLTLAQLHEVLQVAMGWEGYHLYRFGLPSFFGGVDGEHDTAGRLEEILGEPGDRLGYLYDFGDCWGHELVLDKVVHQPRAGTVLPRCSAGRRACPPEDCGGPWGYDETLKALRSRRGWRYQQAKELCGTKFDPEAFDRVTVNAELAALGTTQAAPT